MYEFHVKNLREVQTALKNISLLARAAIASDDSSNNLRSLVRLYALILGCWAETRLRKLLHEQGGFSEAKRQEIMESDSRICQWKSLVDIAFRKHYGLKNTNITRTSIGVASFAYYEVLHEVLDEELAIVIQIRNKLAHGQWIYPLNAKETDMNCVHYMKINKENLLSLQFKYDLLIHLSNLTHDLVVSHETFQRDFESHFQKLEQVRHNLKSRDYSKYKDNLIARRKQHKV